MVDIAEPLPANLDEIEQLDAMLAAILGQVMVHITALLHELASDIICRLIKGSAS